MWRGFGAAIKLDQTRPPKLLDAFARRGNAHAGLAGNKQRAHRCGARIDAERLHRAPEMQRVGRRTEQDGWLVADDNVGSRPGIHAAARQRRQAHFGERVLHAPGQHMRPIAGDHEDRIAFAEVHRDEAPAH